MTSPDTPFRFNEDGTLEVFGRPSMPVVLTELGRQLRLFLARMDSCERGPSGEYLLRGRVYGSMGGARVLWENVLSLGAIGTMLILPPPTPAHREDLERTGIAGFHDGPVQFARSSLPLADVFHALSLAILWNEVGEWRGSVPVASIERIRALAAEVELHRSACSREAVQPTPPVARGPIAATSGARAADRRMRRLEWLARAMLLVRDHPDWTDSRVAVEAGVHRSRLSRSREYKAAAQHARQPRQPGGYLTRDDSGQAGIEAIDDHLDPLRPASRASQEEEDLDARIDRRENSPRIPKRNGRRNTTD